MRACSVRPLTDSIVQLQVLKGLSLRINEGETVALVGPSGSGKSSVIQLIQRFYDADRGSILMGGRDIRDINVGKLRDRSVRTFPRTEKKISEARLL